jgi:hypothetical protein
MGFAVHRFFIDGLPETLKIEIFYMLIGIFYVIHIGN